MAPSDEGDHLQPIIHPHGEEGAQQRRWQLHLGGTEVG